MGRSDSIANLLDRGDRAGAKFLVDANLSRDPSSLNCRWEQADVYCRIGLVEPGLGAAYRAQVAGRGGDQALSQRWLQAWFAEPLFPMSVPDLVVTGLLGLFVEARPQWAVITQ